MTQILVLLGALVALAVLKKALPWLLVRGIGRVFAGAVGEEALRKQPQTIHLVPANASWKDAATADAAVKTFLSLGFEDAGRYQIQEMPGLLVQLLAQPYESMIAVVYEHPQAGRWMDVASRYQDDRSVTFTTSKPTGMDGRPGHAMIHAPGLSPRALFTKAQSERPGGTMRPASADAAVRDFENAYAESMAWRTGKGVSVEEVAEVARRMDKAA